MRANYAYYLCRRYFSHDIYGLHSGLFGMPLAEAHTEHLRAVHHSARSRLQESWFAAVPRLVAHPHQLQSLDVNRKLINQHSDLLHVKLKV